MKNSLFTVSLLLISLALVNCGDSNSNDAGSSPIGTVTLNLDDKAIPLTHDDDLLSMSYVQGDHLLFSVLSKSNDLQFSISAYSTSLDKKNLSVYDCNGPSACESVEDDENQFVLLAPYVKDPLPPVSDSRSAYKAPELGVSPLTMTITEILDEQLQGSPYPTKRVKGNFSGTLVYAEQADAHWVIKGSTKVNGSFDIFCTIR